MSFKQRFSDSWHRWTHFEYWNTWVFYGPFAPILLYYGLRSKGLMFFSNVNSHVPFGGLLEYSKWGMLKNLNQKYVVPTLLVEPNAAGEGKLDGLKYPLILKPDIGERGRGVKKIENKEELIIALKEIKEDHLIQPFVDYPIEVGVLYYRFPNGQSGISSLTLKEFLVVIGDGKKSLGELIGSNFRARKRLMEFEKKFHDSWHRVLEVGEQFSVEEIGNHCRGTKFMNGNHLITPKLVQIFDAIVAPEKAFHYGRFDLKIENMQSLETGEGIAIFELNGVNSEPTHIYDPRNTLFSAYRDVFRHFKLIYLISKALRHGGQSSAYNWSDFRYALKARKRWS